MASSPQPSFRDPVLRAEAFCQLYFISPSNETIFIALYMNQDLVTCCEVMLMKVDQIIFAETRCIVDCNYHLSLIESKRGDREDAYFKAHLSPSVL